MAIHTKGEPPAKSYIDQYRQAQLQAGLPAETDSEGLATTVFVGSTLMTISSVAMNVTFACLIASSLWAKLLYASAYLASDVYKIAAPSLCRFFWLRGNPVFSVVIVAGLAVAVSLSWISGTGFLSETASRTEQQRLHASADYQHNEQRRQQLEAEASALAVSPEAVQQAKAEIERLQAQRQRVLNQNSLYMNEDYTPKGRWGRKTKAIIANELQPLDDAIAARQAILDQAEAYRAKLYEVDRLHDIRPTAADQPLPVFGSLGQWFDIQPAEAKVKVFVLTSIALELISGIGWLAWGMMRKPRQITPDELARANYQHHAQNRLLQLAVDDMRGSSVTAEKNRLTESPTSDFSGSGKAEVFRKNSEAVQTPKSTEAVTSEDDDPQATGHSEEAEKPVLSIPEDGKRAVGGRYPCAQCGSPYTARTTWHKYCEPCRKERDRSAMKKAKGASHEV